MSLEPQPPSKTFALYQVMVSLKSTVDFTPTSVLSNLGITADHLRQNNPEACREVGALADWMHQDGLLVPSARSRGTNLVILTAQVDPTAPLEPTRTQDLRYSEDT